MYVMKYCQILIDDEYESSNTGSQKELGSISGSINLKQTRYTHFQLLNKTVNLIVTGTIKI